jgi:hypothetical protein
MNTKVEKNRIYHPWNLWEDYKAGFYNNCSGDEKKLKIEKVIEMFNSAELTEKYMRRVITEWKYSCEHNLTNSSMNKIAYLGQGACCLYASVPNIITMYAWKFLPLEIRDESDKIARKILLEWEQKRKLLNTYMSGKNEGIKKVYQTKLLLC